MANGRVGGGGGNNALVGVHSGSDPGHFAVEVNGKFPVQGRNKFVYTWDGVAVTLTSWRGSCIYVLGASQGLLEQTQESTQTKLERVISDVWWLLHAG